MIVKIITDDGSLFYDSFLKLNCKYLNSEQFNIYDTDATWVISKETLAKSVLLVGCRKSQSNVTDEYTIKTNATVYLLNDEGKTIERIN